MGPRTLKSVGRLVAGAAFVAALGVSRPHDAVAQGRGNRPITATGNQGLSFGTVFPGVPVTILRTDALNAGQFQIRGANGSLVQVQFTLPAALTGPSGSTVPLVFGAADGGVSPSPTIGTATSFDPRTPLQATLSGQGRLYLYLGGRLTPPAQLAPGAYSATITITVTYL